MKAISWEVYLKWYDAKVVKSKLERYCAFFSNHCLYLTQWQMENNPAQPRIFHNLNKRNSNYENFIYKVLHIVLK